MSTIFNCNVNIILLLSAIIVACTENETVETTHGLVAGKVFRTLIKDVEYRGFMGIPFAAPPVKELRFLPPKEITPWENVLITKKEKPACMQFNTNIKKDQFLGDYGVEDCLYLDIYTPAPDNNQRATVVFLYNEYFKISYNKSRDYAPDFFIEEDVIVVTISHRLSVFGFLSVDEDILPGNAGLKDIVAGLQWVNNNIERFGGDPKRITLMGSQGAAAAIDLLIHSKAKDLFSSAILQSGTSLIPMYLQENIRQRAFKLAELLDRSTSSSSRLIEYLRDIAAEDFLAKELRAAPDHYSKETQKPLLTFGPIVENNSDGLVTEYPENSLQKINIPILIGFNSREGLEPALPYLLEPQYLKSLEKDFLFVLPLRLKFKFDPLDDSIDEAISDIKRFYFNNKKLTMDSIPDFITYVGDVLQSYAIDHMVRMYTNVSDASVYYYHFDYYSDLNENKNSIMKLSKVEEGTWGAATGDDLCYLFKCPSLKQKYLKHHKLETEEFKLQRDLIKLWTNFAKYGNPTPSIDNPLIAQWPPYSMDTKEYLYIGKQIQIKQNLYKERFQFWERFIKKWERLAKNGIVSFNKKDEL